MMKTWYLLLYLTLLRFPTAVQLQNDSVNASMILLSFNSYPIGIPHIMEPRPLVIRQIIATIQFIVQGVSDETYLFYFDIAFFWKSILNFRLLENNKLICPFYACFFVFENLDFGQKVFARGGIRTHPFMSKKREPYHSVMKVGYSLV